MKGRGDDKDLELTSRGGEGETIRIWNWHHVKRGGCYNKAAKRMELSR